MAQCDLLSLPNPSSPHPLHSRHERVFEAKRFVYPVLSRRSRGISVGVNLNPDKICNFDCIYCQVDRTSHAETAFVELDGLLAELEDTLELVTSGEIFETEKFRGTPPALRRLNDIAFSGDGEPTTYRNFDEIVARVAAVKERRRGLTDVKLVLITNASMFHRESTRPTRAGHARRQSGRNLGQAGNRHRRVLPADRTDFDPLSTDSRQHHRRRQVAAGRDPIAVHEGRGPAAFAGRAGSVLRSAQ